MNPTVILIKKINSTLLFLILLLFGFYIYQTISISSGMVSLVNFKKEVLEKKNNLAAVLSSPDRYGNFDPAFIKEKLKMAEIEKFDYITIGPSEFALTGDNSNEQRQ